MQTAGRPEPVRTTRPAWLERWTLRGRARVTGPLMAGVLIATMLVLLGCDGNLTIATGGGSPSATSGSHAIWQVGVQAPPGDAHVSALSVRMQTRLPQKVAANTTNYFWIGSYLSDSSFIQVGYYVPWYQSDQAGWFYCAFADPQSSGDCHDGALGTVDGAGAPWHTYRLEAVTSAGGSGTPGWTASLDGQDVGSFAWSTQDTGTHAPTIFAESSGTTPRATPGDQLGPVDFSQFSVVLSGQRDEQTITAGLPSYNAPNVCPPFGIRPDGHGGVLLGSGLTCPAVLDLVNWG